MVLIIAKNPVTKPALNKTRISFNRREIINQVMVTVEEDVLVVTKIINDMGILNRTSLG